MGGAPFCYTAHTTSRDKPARHFWSDYYFFLDMSKYITIHSDGGARGNPGPSGAGAVIADESGEVISTVSQFLGVQTNNWAEYQALILALTEVAKRFDGEAAGLTINAHLDSELVVRQLGGQYKVREPALMAQFQKVRTLETQFHTVRYTHVPRSQNAAADQLANEAMDSAK
jgi:ribonuclease HI